MPRTLGIKIDGASIPDLEAKMIALLIYGLVYEEIALVLDIEYDSVKTKLCATRGWCEVGDNLELIRKAHAYHFDFYGRVNGVDVLHPLDRKRLVRYIPRLAKEKKLPHLTYNA